MDIKDVKVGMLVTWTEPNAGKEYGTIVHIWLESKQCCVRVHNDESDDESVFYLEDLTKIDQNYVYDRIHTLTKELRLLSIMMDNEFKKVA